MISKRIAESGIARFLSKMQFSYLFLKQKLFLRTCLVLSEVRPDWRSNGTLTLENVTLRLTVQCSGLGQVNHRSLIIPIFVFNIKV